MNLQTPTTTQLSANIVAALEASLEQTVPLLPKAVLRVLAKVLAGVTVLLWRYNSWILLQLFVSWASYDETTVNGITLRPLVEWGRLVGAGDPRGASAAKLTATLPVENQVGDLGAGTQFLHAASGLLYVTTEPTPLNAATITVKLTAANDPQGTGGRGLQGNRTAGEKLSLASPIANVGREATVVATTTPGADAESPDVYRKRVVRRFQRRPQGGASADYQQWGEEAAGVANVYPYTGAPGHAVLYVEAAATESNPDGIPTPTHLQDVLDLCNFDTGGLAARRPVTAYVSAFPITRRALGIKVSGLSPDTSELRSEITSALQAYMREREHYIVGLSTPPRLDRITQPALSGIVDSIVSSAGASFSGLSLLESSTPIPVAQLVQGQKAKLSSVTFA